jgi:uncharacterized membrane protein HdeD (DUF308 family)
MSAPSRANIFKRVTGVSRGWAVIVILLGFVTVFTPYSAAIAVSAFVGWILFFSGIAYIAHAFATQVAGAFLWRILVGMVYVAGGSYLAFHPSLALESLTLVVAATFFIESAFEIVVFFQVHRTVRGSGWILCNGIVTFVLAFLIWRSSLLAFLIGHYWPSSSTWALGTLVGMNIIMSGVTRLMYSVSAHKLLKAIA